MYLASLDGFIDVFATAMFCSISTFHHVYCGYVSAKHLEDSRGEGLILQNVTTTVL